MMVVSPASLKGGGSGCEALRISSGVWGAARPSNICPATWFEDLPGSCPVLNAWPCITKRLRGINHAAPHERMCDSVQAIAQQAQAQAPPDLQKFGDKLMVHAQSFSAHADACPAPWRLPSNPLVGNTLVKLRGHCSGLAFSTRLNTFGTNFYDSATSFSLVSGVDPSD